MASQNYSTFKDLIIQLESSLGIRLHLATLHRWRTRGLHGKKLHAIRLGGRWFSTLDDVMEFLGHDQPQRPAPVFVSSRALQAKQRLKTEFKL